jgi:hypothetical protein
MDSKNIKYTDASFTERREIANYGKDGRHPLMLTTKTKYAKEMKKEIAFDEQLELPTQAVINSMELLQMDIDELTSSKDYYPIDDNILEKIFNIKKFRTSCTKFTIMSYIKGLIEHQKIALWFYLFAAKVSLIFFFVVINLTINPHIIAPSLILMVISIVIPIAISITTLQKKKIKHSNLSVRINKDPITTTKVKLPMGAKLKYKEAKESEIFESFIVAYPYLDLETKNDDVSTSPKYESDPAIIGITGDRRYFMICWWDVKKDIDKINRQLNWVKKFKIEP